MKISLEIMGPVRKTVKTNPVDLDLAEGSTILDMMKHLGYSETEAKFLVYVRGEERLRLFDTLRDNDSIQAVLQVGGG